jgi:hypothetical protein
MSVRESVVANIFGMVDGTTGQTEFQHAIEMADIQGACSVALGF